MAFLLFFHQYTVMKYQKLNSMKGTGLVFTELLGHRK